MTPKQKRIKIAESRGWRADNIWWFNESDPDTYFPFPPNYLNSRDAMAEALAGLTSDREREDFSRNLLKLVALHKPYFDGQECFWDYFHCTTATPAQLAEAYLRTKGLWKDGE